MMYSTPRRLIIAISLALAFATGSVAAAPSNQDMAPADKELQSLYWEGHEALKRSDWSAALQQFERLEGRLRKEEPQAVDSAMYWQAYALTQVRRTNEAAAVVKRLHEEFPDSRWSADADALLRTSGGPVRHGLTPEQELAEIAIEGLMSAPPERAAPLLRKVLESNHPLRLKKRALFVLSQIDAEGALDAVVAVARNGEPALRDEAVRMLGISGQKRALDALEELYAQGDASVRRDVLQAWMVSGSAERIFRVASQEPDEKLRREAVHLLGAMGATKQLKQLYEVSKDDATRRAMVQAFGVAGDTQALVEIAGGNSSEKIRIEAMQALGVAGGGKQLVALYPQATTPKLRDAVLQGLMIAGDGDGLLQIYRSAKTTEEKKAALRMLSLTGDDAAIDAIEAALDK